MKKHLLRVVAGLIALVVLGLIFAAFALGILVVAGLLLVLWHCSRLVLIVTIILVFAYFVGRDMEDRS